MDRVCVLIPVYNDTDRLKRTLESLQAVPSDGVRFMILDDGSKTPVQLNPEWAGIHRIDVIRFEKNLGLTGVLNAGLEVVFQQNPEFIGRVDAGDLVVPERFSEQIKFLDDHPEVVVVGTAVCFFQSADRMTGFVHRPPTDHEDILKSLYYGNSMIHSTLLMRTSSLRKIGGYRSEMKIAQDYDLVRRLSRVGRLATLPTVLTYCDTDSSGISIKRRRWQQIYRLKIQLEWVNLTRVRWYLGVARTMIAICTPHVVALVLKRYRW